jgi:outer membrane protein, multidrug efflux system
MLRPADPSSSSRRERNFVTFCLGLAVLLATGCTVGPNYRRPVVATPQSYRSAQAPDISDSIAAPSVAEQQWSAVFQDEALQHLLQDALESNLDLHIAATHVLEAEAQVGIVRSQQYPSIGAGGSFSALQLPASLAGTSLNGSRTTTFYDGGGPSASGAWNLDFWGMYRRQSEAARAELLASEWGQRAARTTLVEEVALAYFRLRSLDAQLLVTRDTIAARQDSLRLTTSLEKYGAGSRADTSQAEELLHAAEANLPELRRQIVEEENILSLLLGRPPSSMVRGRSVADQAHPLHIPVGLPSELLERRPDIQQAEARLKAANARIGVARAQYFPQLSLTGSGGVTSDQLQSVFTGPATYWFAAASLSQPIFEGGRIRSNYQLSQAQRDEMVLAYRKTILSALKEVSNALTAYQETGTKRKEQLAQVEAAKDAVRLARVRYEGGFTNYLEVLTTDTDLYDAQLHLAQTQEQEAASLVQVYAALGGGWQ